MHLEFLPRKTAWSTAILSQLTPSARLAPLTARSIRVWLSGGWEDAFVKTMLLTDALCRPPVFRLFTI